MPIRLLAKWHGLRPTRQRHQDVPDWRLEPTNRPEKGGSTENVTRIGLDLPKNLYELYGVEAHHREVLSKQVRRAR
jgi:hypothetical protein